MPDAFHRGGAALTERTPRSWEASSSCWLTRLLGLVWSLGGVAGVGQSEVKHRRTSAARERARSRCQDREPREAGAERERGVLTPASTSGCRAGRRCGLLSRPQTGRVDEDENYPVARRVNPLAGLHVRFGLAGDRPRQDGGGVDMIIRPRRLLCRRPCLLGPLGTRARSGVASTSAPAMPAPVRASMAKR